MTNIDIDFLAATLCVQLFYLVNTQLSPLES
jgi:hypothetical protein